MVDYDDHTDDELTTLLKKGDEAAFEEIYKRYWDKLFYMAHRIVKSSEIAEEITQDTFMGKKGNIDYRFVKAVSGGNAQVRSLSFIG